MSPLQDHGSSDTAEVSARDAPVARQSGEVPSARVQGRAFSTGWSAPRTEQAGIGVPSDNWLAPFESLRASFRRAFTPGLLVTPTLMVRIAQVFLLFGFLSFGLSAIGASLLGIAYRPSIAACFVVTGLLAIHSAWCGSQGRLTCSYVSLTGAACSIQIAGAFFAGYGVHAPALMIGLIPLSLGYLMFPRRHVLLWGGPVLLLWLAVVVCHQLELTGLTPITPHPLVFNVVLNMLAVMVSMGAVLHLLTTQAEAAYQASREETRVTTRSLETETQAREDLERFIGHLSHEIRNPIAALRNAVNLLAHPRATPAVRDRSLHVVDVTSQNLLELLNNSLDLLKYGDRAFTVRNQPMCLHLLSEELKGLFEPAAAAKGLDLLVDVQAPVGGLVNGDVLRLRQMLSNLLSNAIKFTEQGEVVLRIRAVGADRSSMWRFETLDTGPGISVADQERLFRPFVQVHDATRYNAGGTGLGLSIVRQLADAMGGRTGLDSEPGKGSAFWFEVPLPTVQATA